MSALEGSGTHAGGLAALAAAQFAAQGSDVTVYRDRVPDDTDLQDDGTRGPRYPYVVFWSAPGGPQADAERLAGWGGEISTTTQATVCGLSEDDVIGACDRLTYALHRRKPILAGRVPGDIEQDGVPGRPTVDPVPSPDGRPVFMTFLFFTLHSSPKRN